MSQRDSVRRSYDAVAGEYADGFRDGLAAKPLDRVLLASLASPRPRRTPAEARVLSE